MFRAGISGFVYCICVALVSLLQINVAYGAVYYVEQKNPAASDNNPGTEAAPWLSLNPTGKVKLLAGDVVLVKEGVYSTVSEANEYSPIINPHDSGSPGKPIIFKSSPAFAATIEGGNNLLAPIQITHQSHIVIEGFKITNPGKNAILIAGDINKPLDGIAIRNNAINDEVNNTANMTNGINVQYAINTVIDNNKIRYGKDEPRRAEATAIRLSNVTNQFVKNNEIANLSTGISIQNNALNVNANQNLILNTQQAFRISSDTQSKIGMVRISNNITNMSELAVSLLPEGGVIHEVFVNNNIFNQYSVAAVQLVQPGMGKIEIWNNIFSRADPGAIFIADIFTYDDPPASIARMDYNLYAEQPLFITGLYSSNRRLYTLNVWQEYSGQDAHSVVEEVAFVEPGKNDYRLVVNTRNLIQGAMAGDATSGRVDVGAYSSQTVAIGVIDPYQIEQETPAPVETSAKTKSAQNEADTAAKPEITSVAEVAVTPALPVTAAQAKESKPTSKPGKLKWKVRRKPQFDNQCVMESSKVDFFDGYDNTGLGFRVLKDELYLLTKSNIDMSFHDVGIQVGKNDFLHADTVVQDQNVIIKKEFPKFLTQLRKTGKTRVQLRFWPSYPATRAYSEVVLFGEFLPAYKIYQDCIKGN